MPGYYSEKLSADRLKRVYEIATPRINRYLESEIAHVVDGIGPGDSVIELGCGYSRVLRNLNRAAESVIGIDSSLSGVEVAREYLADVSNCYLFTMDAAALGFRDQLFDVVACIQNGISAFNVNPHDLVSECVRVTRPGGGFSCRVIRRDSGRIAFSGSSFRRKRGCWGRSIMMPPAME